MQPAMSLPQTTDPEIDALVARYGRNPEAVLPILKSLNAQRGALTREIVLDVAAGLGLPAQRVEGVATFYALLNRDPQAARIIRQCDSPTCWLKGAEHCRRSLEAQAAATSGWSVVRNSCLGLCDRAPAAFVDGRQYGPLTPETPLESFEEESTSPLSNGEPLEGELRFLLARAGHIDPQSIDEALAAGAYWGLSHALRRPAGRIIDEIEKSGLRGRGGARFPTGRKWRMVAESPEPVRYVICNADESEPLTFKDRVLMDGDPHAILEGMTLCAYAVGASEAIIYVRGEYEPQARLLEHAIEQATRQGWLGDNIAGSGFSLRVHVHRGAGAYICGEETALLESLEGRRGEPRIRPPYPAISGYRGHATIVNNVETFAAAAAIVAQGAEFYSTLGSPDCHGTRLFTLQGHVNRTGIIELPFGLTLREIIERFGQGMPGESKFRFALTGGAAGSFVGESLLDIPLDGAAADAGICLGSGGILVCDQSVSPVQMLREVFWFFEHESCGKCTPCRVGTSEARRTLDELLAGRGAATDLDRLRRIADSLAAASFCGLGTSAAEPIRSTLNNFPKDFQELIAQ
jgi:NADH-quinone oxidoreductase subunit F